MNYFAYIAGYDSGFDFKLGPEIALGFTQTVGLKPQDILVVGYNHYDSEVTRCASTGVLTGTSERKNLRNIADHVVVCIAELEGLV